jgi:hypothetical protein
MIMRLMPAVLLAVAGAVIGPKVAAAQERYDPNKYDPVRVEKQRLDEQDREVRRYEAQQEEERRRKAGEEEKAAAEERQRNSASPEPDPAAQRAAYARVAPVAAGNWVLFGLSGENSVYLDTYSFSKSGATRLYRIKVRHDDSSYDVVQVNLDCPSRTARYAHSDAYDNSGNLIDSATPRDIPFFFFSTMCEH